MTSMPPPPDEYELRDWIAVVAFQTLMSGSLPLIKKHCDNPTKNMRASAYDMAKTCYAFADAMMAAREVERDFSKEQEEELDAEKDEA
jgi:hypothetical protein